MKIALIFVCLGFLGFNTVDKTLPVNETQKYLPYEIYTEGSDRQKAPFEKDECMTGAYIKEENNYSGIKGFEDYTAIENHIYITRVKKGDNLPLSDILDCYAKGKIPMLELTGDYGSTNAMSAAKALGNMNIPMFVEIKNCSSNVYNCLAEIFREYAPKTVLVYGINSSSNDYSFPKENLVDWVALNACEKMNNGIIVSEYENISKWCNYFKDKTIMLNISVPNFSTDRCNYAYKEASDEITRLYSLVMEYSNIGAVNYISCIEKNNGIVSANYRITENIMLTSAYKRAVENIASNRYWNKTPYVAYVSDNNVLVSNDAVIELGVKGEYINSGYSYINVSGFNKSERKVFVKS